MRLCTSPCSAPTHWEQTLLYAPHRINLNPARTSGAGERRPRHDLQLLLEGEMALRAGLPGRPRGLEIDLEWRLHASRTASTGDEEAPRVLLSQNKTFALFMYVGDLLDSS